MANGRIFLVGIFSLLLLFFFSCASQMYSQEDMIKERRKLMKSSSKANKEIKKAVKAKDFAKVVANAKVISASMEKLPSLFPKGSTSKKSRAKPEIWKKWKSFTGSAKSNKEVADLLIESAMAKDKDKVAVLAKGIDCKSCHKKFRKKKKKKKK